MDQSATGRAIRRDGSGTCDTYQVSEQGTMEAELNIDDDRSCSALARADPHLELVVGDLLGAPVDDRQRRPATNAQEAARTIT